jgi:hypothetical protein
MDNLRTFLFLLGAQLQIVTALYLLMRNRAIQMAGAAEEARRRRQRRRAFWVRPWLLRRPQFGQYERLMRELQREDVTAFRNFVRVPPALFRELLERVGPRIQKKDTHWRKALPAALKIAVTLRYLATGNSYRSLQYGFRVAFNTISKFIPEVCEAIIAEYFDDMVSCPSTPEGWKEVAEGFASRWNLPHCIGALDGKHVAIRCPANTGSIYYNYKGYYSLVLMALVDSNCQFLYVDVGANGGGSDGGVFGRTDLRRHLDNETLGLPPPDPLPNDDQDFPYYIAGDEAFPLRSWLMKPIPKRNLSMKQRIFNYRLSRGRRIVENAFGLLASRFRCLLTTMPQPPDTVISITMACVAMHNLIRKRYPTPADIMLVDQENPETHAIIPGAWRDNAQMDDMGDVARGNVATKSAKLQRLYLVEYFNSEAGSVSWQQDMI